MSQAFFVSERMPNLGICEESQLLKEAEKVCTNRKCKDVPAVVYRRLDHLPFWWVLKSLFCVFFSLKSLRWERYVWIEIRISGLSGGFFWVGKGWDGGYSTKQLEELEGTLPNVSSWNGILKGGMLGVQALIQSSLFPMVPQGLSKGSLRKCRVFGPPFL